MSSVLRPGRVRTEVVGPEGQSINYHEESDGSLTPRVRIAASDISDAQAIPVRQVADTFAHVIEYLAFVEQRTDADVTNDQVVFNGHVDAVEIWNRDETTGVFTVNGANISVPPDTVFGPVRVAGPASQIVVVSGTTEFVISRYTA